MVYYLKVNRNCEYALRNLQNWIDIIEFDLDSKIYIICDNSELKEKILSNVCSTNPYSIIESVTNEDTLKIVHNTCIEKWYNAGLAHLTTFWHARENSISEFWNIDADDTLICLQPNRSMELLKKIREYAILNHINLFSLDMWTTVVENVYNTFHWTFGITYTNGNIDWFEIMNKHCYDEELKKLPLIDNLDKFYTYLAIFKQYGIATFCINNLKFIHYSDDLFYKFEGSGFYQWGKKYLFLPIIYNCLGAKKRGKLKISKKVIKLDMSITKKEALLFLNVFAFDKLDIQKEK